MLVGLLVRGTEVGNNLCCHLGDVTSAPLTVTLSDLLANLASFSHDLMLSWERDEVLVSKRGMLSPVDIPMIPLN